MKRGVTCHGSSHLCIIIWKHTPSTSTIILVLSFPTCTSSVASQWISGGAGTGAGACECICSENLLLLLLLLLLSLLARDTIYGCIKRSDDSIITIPLHIILDSNTISYGCGCRCCGGGGRGGSKSSKIQRVQISIRICPTSSFFTLLRRREHGQLFRYCHSFFRQSVRITATTTGGGCAPACASSCASAGTVGIRIRYTYMSTHHRG